MRTTWILAVAAAAALGLAGCGSGHGSSGAPTSPSTSPPTAGAASTAVLSTWESPLGTIVVTGTGRAVYVFDKDTAGASTSACTGACAFLWPAVATSSSSPHVSGVTGTVGTAPGPNGTQQVTLDGHRLYTYSGDTGGRQVSGQGVMGLWWVVGPDGAKITAAPAATSSGAGQGPTY